MTDQKEVKVNLGYKTRNSIILAVVKEKRDDGLLVIKGTKVVKANVNRGLLERLMQFDTIIEESQIIG